MKRVYRTDGGVTGMASTTPRTFTGDQEAELKRLGFHVCYNCAQLMTPGLGMGAVYLWTPGSVAADSMWYADTGGGTPFVAFDDPIPAAVYLKVETGA